MMAIVFNRLMGRQYPQKLHLNVRSTDPTPTQKVTIQPQDIQDVLDHQTELLDISQYQLEKSFWKHNNMRSNANRMIMFVVTL